MMKNKLIFLAAVLWLGLPGLVRATAQIPDLLIVGSDTLALFCNPLEGYFDNEHPRPNKIFGISSTNCWRGYQAYFELRQDSLFLTGIRLGSRGDSTDFYPLVKLFGDKATNKGVFAYWVNNPLISVRGKCLFYIHMGYASVYEFEEEFIVRQGLVKEKRIYDNRKSFLPFASGHDGVRNIWASDYSLLKTFVESQIDYSRLKPDDLDDCVDVSIKKVDGEGHIKKVLFERGLPSHRQKRAIRRALKKVPRYNVIYRRGKPIDEIYWTMRVRFFTNEEEQAKHSLTKGPDLGEWAKERMSEDYDYVRNLKFLAEKYHEVYESWKKIIADTSASERQYKEYFCRLFDDSLLYQHHYFTTLGDSALKYYYQYWDMTGDYEALYPTIMELEKELGRPHNPKIVKKENEEFVYLVLPNELDASHQADSAHLHRRCRQVSYHLRGFGEGDLHEPLPEGIQEEWRLLLLRGNSLKNSSPVLVKLLFDGKDARIIWRVAKEDKYNTYPGLEHFHHGIESEGERLLTPDEWKHLKDLADVAGVDTLHLDNDYFTSPPAIYNVEYRTVNSYHVVNDYSHPYYGCEINPLFWPYREFCKYLIHLADPSLPFDSDDKH